MIIDEIVANVSASSATKLRTALADTEEASSEYAELENEAEDEIDKNDEPTGRIRIKFGVIGYGGKIHVLDLYASEGAKSHIQDSWNKEDTVKVTGRVNVTKKIEQIEEKQGFGESIIKTRTISTKELIITGGSASGLEEELSYDSDSIKKALGDRRAKIDELIENSKNSTSKAAPKNKSTDFGF